MGTKSLRGSDCNGQHQNLFALFSARQLILSGIFWAIHLLKFPLSKRRYLSLSPPIFCRQFFFDRKQKKLFCVEIRGWNDWQTTTQIFYEDDYGLEKLRRFDAINGYYSALLGLNQTPLIIDCGGNIGLATRYFSDNYPGAKLLCVEPDARNIDLAKRNNKKSTNTQFIEAAVGSESARGQLIDPGLGNSGYRISAEPQGSTEIIDINTILGQFDSTVFRPFIVKIDIEGFEAELFSKNTDWIEKFPILIIELHDWLLPKSGSSRNFINAISKLDRDFIFYGENVFSVSNTLI